MRIMRSGSVAALLAGTVLCSGSGLSWATLYCDIRQTEDGYAALRAGPSDTAELIARMVPGDDIRLGQDQSGDWVEVTYWRGGEFASGNSPTGDPPTASGWMREADIAPDSCG